MSDKLVSVIMAVGKFDKYLPTAIKSILTQSYSNIELIIVANGPNGKQIKNSIQTLIHDSRIKVYSISLLGLTNALNYGITFSNGDYIARMDADDISLHRRIENQTNFLNQNIEYGVVGCRVKLIDEFDNILPDNFFYFETNTKIKKILPIYNPICHPAVMFRKTCLEEVGAYKYGFMSEDHELFIRISETSNWKFHNINEVLFYYRRHNSQITKENSHYKNFIEISAFLFFYFLKTFNLKYLIGIFYILPPIIYTKKLIRRLIRIIKQ